MEQGVESGTGRYAAPRAGAEAHPATETLRIRYEAYRRRQGRELLALVPREGLRHLLKAYRRTHGPDTGAEPALGQLAEFASSLIPLPPFGIWLEDFHRHRGAHLVESEPPLADGPGAPGGEPVTVEVRAFDAGRDEWVAELQVRSVPEGWRGSIHFHRPGEARAGCTGEIFREGHVTALRDRFRACDAATLHAFLRSALP